MREKMEGSFRGTLVESKSFIAPRPEGEIWGMVGSGRVGYAEVANCRRGPRVGMSVPVEESGS